MKHRKGTLIGLHSVFSIQMFITSFYFTSSVLNMFRILIHPSSGACDFYIVSPHWLCTLQRWRFLALWRQVGLLLFNYHNDARSNIHEIQLFLKFLSCIIPFLFSCMYLKTRKYTIHYLQVLINVIKNSEKYLKIPYSNYRFHMQTKPLNVGLQLQMQKLLHQLSLCLPSQMDQNRDKEYSILWLLLLASCTVTQMSKLAKQKSTVKEYSIETLGKFIVSKLRDTRNASNG